VSPSAVVTLAAIALPVALLAIAFFTGRRVERRHYASIRAREKALAMLPAVTFRQIPDAWAVDDTGVVAGSVVVSADSFERFLAGLRTLVGGRIASYESLLDRARREAILRCKEAARARGYQAVVNLRLETTRIPRARRNHRATAGVEVFALGTGLELRRDPR
jgi:uncharacterized protein YbjQ (UPF0145 family)